MGTPRLAELETRIADAQAKLDALLLERDSLVWNLQRCTDVLNPVRRLPSDVLCEIFAHSITDPGNSYYFPAGMKQRSSKNTIPRQWKLGMVSLNWRHTVLTSPRMWSMIDLTFWPSFLSSGSRGSIRADLGAERLLAMHIYRSANRPLQVTLRGRIPNTILLILISASYRWEHLCLDYRNLKAIDSPLDALVSFRYILDERGRDETIHERLPLLRNVTSLRRLTVDKLYPVVHPGLFIIPWTQIYSVVVTESFPDKDAIAPIKLAPKLDTVEFLTVNHSPLDLFHVASDSVHSGSLRSFSLNVKLPDTVHGPGARYSSTVTVLFDSLTLPALERFRVAFGGACGLAESIVRLLRRSQCHVLKRLALIGASKDDLKEILGAGELQNMEELLIEKLENAAHLQSVLELLAESAGLLRLRTVEIDASAVEGSILACQDAVIRFMESRQMTNEGFGRLESLTLRAPAEFEISEANVQRLEALRSLGARLYIYRL